MICPRSHCGSLFDGAPCFPPVPSRAVPVCQACSLTTGGSTGPSSGGAREGGGEAPTDPSAHGGPQAPALAFTVLATLRAGGRGTSPTLLLNPGCSAPLLASRPWAAQSSQLEDKQLREPHHGVSFVNPIFQVKLLLVTGCFLFYNH